MTDRTAGNALLIMCLIMTPGLTQAQEYEVFEIGPITGQAGKIHSVTGISDDGLVALTVRDADQTTRAAYWRDGEIREIPFSDDENNSRTTAISNNGHILVHSSRARLGNCDSESYAVVWYNMEIIGEFPVETCNAKFNDITIFASDINSSGVVIGPHRDVNPGSLTNPLTLYTRRWTPPAYGCDNGICIDDTLSRGVRINDSGQILGEDGERILEAGSPWVIGRNGATREVFRRSDQVGGEALRDLNNNGHAVGTLDNGGGRLWAAFWNGEDVRFLGTLGGRTSSADAINDNDQVVGLAQNEAGDYRAFLWRGESVIDLNDLISPGEWVLERAADINILGEIVGSGTRDGVEAFFLLRPIAPPPPPPTDEDEPRIPEPVDMGNDSVDTPGTDLGGTPAADSPTEPPLESDDSTQQPVGACGPVAMTMTVGFAFGLLRTRGAGTG